MKTFELQETPADFTIRKVFEALILEKHNLIFVNKDNVDFFKKDNFEIIKKISSLLREENIFPAKIHTFKACKLLIDSL